MGVLTAGAGGLRRSALAVLDLLLPPRCLACGVTVPNAGAVCAECWRGLRFISSPMCGSCGFPFDYDYGAGALCGECARRLPPYHRARAVLRYDNGSRDLVIAFKHRDRTDAAPAYGAWMVRAGAELLEDADLLIPVPLHRMRLIQRRFNQSALLAHALAARSGVACTPDALIRTRPTPSQGQLSRSARARNVQGAFKVRRAGHMEGRRIVLVDDVLTTGATVSSCARALLRAGAESVDVLTLARVVRA